MFLSNLSIRRPVFATVLMLSLVTLGVASYRRLAIDLYPNVEIPVITIVTVYPGGSPETVEREVSKRIEEAVHPIAGVRHVGSSSREGVSQIFVEFELEVSADRAVQDARTKIAAIRGDLPAGIEDPIIEKLDIAGMPIVSLAIRSASLSPRDLTTLVDKKIKPRLETVGGVGKVDLVGAVTREIVVEIAPDRLEALGLGVDEVMAGLRRENVDVPLGRMSGAAREALLRVQGRATTVGDLRQMVVATRGERPIVLGDVADVSDGVEEVRSLAFVDGAPAVALDVLKQTGANAVGVADAVRKEATALTKELPAGTTMEFVRDGSTMIRESVADVQQTLVIGGLLTILIVFVFLNSWRSTVITGLTLPISVISSFIVMNFAGMTLNVMTLMALSLAIGLLIDDAIVVRENIVRHLERGEDHFEAARQGTSEIGLAVLATTFSIIAVFVPVAFMKGIVGRFFFAFGITVAFAVLVSLFVSFTLDPMLSSRWIDPDIARSGRRNPISRLLDVFNRWFERTADGYRSVIAWALRHRLVVVALAFVAFAGGLGVMSVLQSEFFPLFDQGEFVVLFKTAPGASIDETRGRLDAVTATLKKFPEVERLYASIGAGAAGTVRDARVYIKLTPREEHPRRAQHEVERDLRQQLLRIPGIVSSLGQAASLDNRKLLLVNLRGDDITTLKEYSRRLKDALYRVRGVVDLEATLEHDMPEYRLIVDRERAFDIGLNSGAISATLGPLVGGQIVTTFEDEAGESRNVRVRLPQTRRADVTHVQQLRVSVLRPAGVTLIPIASVTRHELSTMPSEIGRMDLSRQVTVSGNLDGLPLGTAVAKVRAITDGLQLPAGYRAVISGENEAMEESFRYMGEALILAIVFVYLILAAQFESFIDPLAIMLSLPLSIVGMAATLLLTGDTINIMSMIGLIMLMGLVTKNAILLVDYSKVLRSRGLDRTHAVIEAGRVRLRPIIMTTSAMVFGMLPLALGLGSGGEMRAPMARAVIGGLITSTVLTLVVVPIVYTLLDDVAAWLQRHRAHAVAAGVTAGLVMAGVLIPARIAAAQEPAPSVRTLTLDEALAVATAQNHDVRKAVEYENWVRAKYVEERANALPKVTFNGNVLRQYDDTQSRLFRSVPAIGASGSPDGLSSIGEIFGGRQDIRIAEVRFAQPIFTWGQVGAGIRAARVGYALAEGQLRRAHQAVERDVATAFYDTLVARELASLAREDLAQKQRHLDETTRRRTLGTATDYDVLASQVAVNNARPAVVHADNGVRGGRDRLRFLLAESTADIDVIGTLAGEIEPPPAYEEVLDRALRNRPEVGELASQRSIYRELVTIAAAGSKPRVDFSSGLGTRSMGLPSIGSTGTTWNAAIVATVPLFDGFRTSGRVAQAKTDLSRAALDERKLRDAIALEARTAVNAVQESADIATGLRGTVQQAERLVFLAEKGYELGVKTHLEVQDALLNLLAAKSNLARALRDYDVARVNLEWVAGANQERKGR